MALFGLFKRRRSLAGGKLVNKGDYKKVAYQPTVILKPPSKPRSGAVTKKNLHRQNRFIVFKRILLGLLALALISVVVYGVYQLLRNPYFALNKITVLGNKTVSDTELNSVLEKFKNTNIFLVKPADVEREISSTFPIFNGVEVDKFYPNILFIKISEREAKLVYVNLSGAYLVDSNGQVLDQITISQNELTPEKINIYRGFGNPDSILVRDRLLAEFGIANQLDTKPEEEKQLIISTYFNFEKIPLAEKERVLAALKNEIGEVIEGQLAQNNQIVAQSPYASYPKVDVMEVGLYKGTETIELDRLNLTLELLGLFSSRSLPVVRVVWEGELLVTVTVAENKIVIFGLNRKASDQFEDYLLVVNQLNKEGKDFSRIDVSSSKVSVMR